MHHRLNTQEKKKMKDRKNATKIVHIMIYILSKSKRVEFAYFMFGTIDHIKSVKKKTETRKRQKLNFFFVFAFGYLKMVQHFCRA